MRTSCLILSAVNAVFALVILSAVLVVEGPGSLSLIFGLLGGLSIVIVPEGTCLFFLALLPVLGNRPSTHQSFVLQVLVSGLMLGAGIRFILRKNRQQLLKGISSGPISIWLLASVLVAFASISALPWGEVFNQLRSQIASFSDVSAISFLIHRTLRAGEEQLLYSPLSVVWTSYAVELGLLLSLFAARDSRYLLNSLIAIGIGLALSLVVGLLDYYNLIDLHWLRGLDPVVNPGDVQFRIQSFFGHSGWFAEYITLCMPFVLVLLLLPIRFRVRVAIILILLMLGEFVLILSFQRGGWLSYPITLLAIWSAIYVTARIERGETRVLPALRASALKVIVSLPLTVLVSLVILQSLSSKGALPQAENSSFSVYSSRFKDIQKTSDRTNFFRAGLKLGSLQPIFGLGSESFAWQFEQEFNQPQGEFFRQIDLPLHGSAHNVYMQTFSGKGVLGLVVLLGLVLSALVLSMKVVLLNNQVAYQRKIELLIISCFCFAFLIYGNVQEVFYIQILQYLFYAVMGICAAALSIVPGKQFLTLSRVVVITICGLLLHLVWSFYLPGRSLHARQAASEYGCFNVETTAEGKSYRWCGVRARQKFEVTEDAGRSVLNLRLEAAPLVNAGLQGTKSATIQLRVGKLLIWEKLLSPGQIITEQISLPESLKGQMNSSKQVLIDLSTAHYFLPQRDLENSQDARVLAYKLYNYKW